MPMLPANVPMCVDMHLVACDLATHMSDEYFRFYFRPTSEAGEERKRIAVNSGLDELGPEV